MLKPLVHRLSILVAEHRQLIKFRAAKEKAQCITHIFHLILLAFARELLKRHVANLASADCNIRHVPQTLIAY